MGMPVDEYWNGSPIMAKMYRKAWELQQRENNRNMWLQGLYIYEALCDVSPVLHAFAKRGTKPREYLNEPIALTQAEVDERKERGAKRRYEDMRARVSAWAAQKNIGFAEEAGKEVRDNE